MQNSTFAYLAIVFFVLAISMVLSAMSGWFKLMRHFPDSGEKSLLTLNFISGRLGFINLNHCLHLSCCPSGLRIAMFRALGPFSKPFLIPWSQLDIKRVASIWGEVAVLQFGKPLRGTLIVPGSVADRFALIMKQTWPEVRSASPNLTRKAFDRFSDYVEVVIYWLVSAFLFAVIFAMGNLVLTPNFDASISGPEFAMAGVAGFVVVLRKYWRKRG
jgi:hypothetical protein